MLIVGCRELTVRTTRSPWSRSLCCRGFLREIWLRFRMTLRRCLKMTDFSVLLTSSLLRLNKNKNSPFIFLNTCRSYCDRFIHACFFICLDLVIFKTSWIIPSYKPDLHPINSRWIVRSLRPFFFFNISCSCHNTEEKICCYFRDCNLKWNRMC